MALTANETPPLVLRLTPTMRQISDREFSEFCHLNRELRIERTAEGDLVIMPPTGGGTGRRNSRLNQRLANWAEADGTGTTFDSSTGFSLPSGAKRSPDAAWMLLSRWEALTVEEQEEFPPICPDFVAELRSRSDPLETLQAKMEEYLASGARLGWLIDPIQRCVYVYRPGMPVERRENPRQIAGDPLLPGFVLDLEEIWE